MKHLMLDLETFGTRPGAVIRSIGAVLFDLDGNTGDTFYANIDKKSCLDVGLVVDPETERWWTQQPAAAQKALTIDPLPLADVVRKFSTWYFAKSSPAVWGQGANFDPPLWEAAAIAAGGSAPWKFWNVRDTRTVYDIFNFDTRDIVRMNVHHNALDDAKHQVALVAAALKKFRAKPVASAGVFE